MQRLPLLAWLAVAVVGVSCSKALQVGGAGAGRDSGTLDCSGQPRESCGYACEGGNWVPIPLLCLRDSAVPGAGNDSSAADLSAGDASSTLAPDDATADSAPTCVQGASNDAGSAASCLCLPRRGSACPAGGPQGLPCDDAGLNCDYGANACGIVSCACMPSDGGLRWSCQVLLL